MLIYRKTNNRQVKLRVKERKKTSKITNIRLNLSWSFKCYESLIVEFFFIMISRSQGRKEDCKMYYTFTPEMICYFVFLERNVSKERHWCHNLWPTLLLLGDGLHIILVLEPLFLRYKAFDSLLGIPNPVRFFSVRAYFL